MEWGHDQVTFGDKLSTEDIRPLLKGPLGDPGALRSAVEAALTFYALVLQGRPSLLVASETERARNVIPTVSSRSLGLRV